MSEECPPGFRRIECVESSAPDTDPEVVAAVFGDAPDIVAAEARPGGRIVNKMLKSVSIAVVAIQTAAICPDPQVAAGIFTHAIDVVVRKGERVMDIVAIDLERVAVKSVQAVLRSQPDVALMILNDAADL
jgi:hypothetical protein